MKININIKWSFLLAMIFSLSSCIKNEPLDLEANYKQKNTERAKELALKEQEAQKKAEEEQNKIWDSYYQMLTQYKQKAWTGEKPFSYMFWTGWRASNLERTWLQSIPDSITAISLWGGYGKQPEDMTENEKFDLEIFHKKGSVAVLCWQVSNTGLGLPSENGKGGFDIFKEKYGEDKSSEGETKRVKIYARELARYIISVGLDGFDIDWEPTVGDHGSGYNEFASSHGSTNTNGYLANMNSFVEEISLYFGKRYSGEERKQHLKNLFDENFAGYHEKEKEYIKRYKPFFEKNNYADKKYYLLFDGQFPPLKDIDVYFDKYIMQDYGRVNGIETYLRSWTVGSGPNFIPPYHRASSTAEFEKGQYKDIISKANAYKNKQVGGVSSYHGELDYSTTAEDVSFKAYLEENKIQGRKYKHYAWMREAIRIMDPRGEDEYKDYKETIIIRKPNQ